MCSDHSNCQGPQIVVNGVLCAQVHNAFEQHVGTTDVEGFMGALGFERWNDSRKDPGEQYY